VSHTYDGGSKQYVFDDGSYVLILFEEILAETDKAVLVRISKEDRIKEWIPRSQIGDLNTDTKELWITQWIAEQKGLEHE